MYKPILYILIILLLNSCYKENFTVSETIVKEYPEVIIDSTNFVIDVLNDKNELTDYQSVVIENGTLINNQKNVFHCTSIKKYGENISIINNEGLKFSYPVFAIENSTNYYHFNIPSSMETILFENKNETNIYSSSLLNININQNSILQGTEIINETEIKIFKNGLNSNTSIPHPILLTDQLQTHFLDIKESFFIGLGKESESLVCTDFKSSNNSPYPLYFYNASTASWQKMEESDVLKSGFYALANEVPGLFSEINVVNSEKPVNLLFDLAYEDNSYNLGITEKYQMLSFLPSKSEIELRVGASDFIINNKTVVSSENINIEFDEINDKTKRIYVTSKSCENEELHHFNITVQDNNHKNTLLSNIGNIFYYYQNNSGPLTFYINRNNEQSAELTLAESDTYWLGSQFICSAIKDNYILINNDLKTEILSNVQLDIQANEIIISGETNSTTITLKCGKKQSGIIDDEFLNIQYQSEESKGYRLNCLESEEGCGFDEFIIRHYSEKSENYIRGEFKGIFWIESTEDNNVGYRYLEGEFQVQIQ